MGGDNFNYHLFRFLSLEHPETVFYHVFKKSLIHKILRNFSKKPVYDRDLLVVLRSDEKVE